jgi:hypothetical protein
MMNKKHYQPISNEEILETFFWFKTTGVYYANESNQYSPIFVLGTKEMLERYLTQESWNETLISLIKKIYNKNDIQLLNHNLNVFVNKKHLSLFNILEDYVPFSSLDKELGGTYNNKIKLNILVDEEISESDDFIYVAQGDNKIACIKIKTYIQ